MGLVALGVSRCAVVGLRSPILGVFRAQCLESSVWSIWVGQKQARSGGKWDPDKEALIKSTLIVPLSR